jgi:hypothetical protein
MRKSEVDLIRCHVVKRLVRTLFVIHLEPALDALFELLSIIESPKVDILIFE